MEKSSLPKTEPAEAKFNENSILDMMVKEYSWEQIMYDVIAVNALDPWDIDIGKLSDTFIEYIDTLETMDFKVPAKYIIIASVLLRMKAEHLDIVQKILQEEQKQDEVQPDITYPPLALQPLSIPPHRMPLRKVLVSELIDSLRKALKTTERRETRELVAREKIEVKSRNINARIASLYKKINSILSKLRKEEVSFSRVVGEWDRNKVIDTFIPLVYLDHDKKIHTRQEEFFKEIFIKKCT